jgi:DNA-binding PadR family transcriptional regulator
MAAISNFIHEATVGTFAVEDQSLYRALRRYHDAELIDYQDVPVDKGPQRKKYALTKTGVQLLQGFLERNIIPVYYVSRVQKLITQ